MIVPTSERIKQSALQVFAQKGYHGTSLNDVAEMVGIKKPSLYAHFKNKDDLYTTILTEIMDTFKDRVTLTPMDFEKLSAKELLLKFVNQMVDYWKDETLGLLYKRSLLFPEDRFKLMIHEQFVETEVFTTNILKQIFKKGFQNKEINNQPVEPLIDAYYCLVDGLFVQRFFYESADYEKKVTHAFEHYWQAIDPGGSL
jgi:AcrR family transcriptional regulator